MTIPMGHYSSPLVFLSFLLATFAAWVALDMSARIYRQSQKRRKAVWLISGAFAMGTGIWSMHYVGMLAYRMDMPVLYDWPTVLLSILAAFAASGIALSIVAREALSWRGTILGGMVMGSAIASMHYIGMAAMRMPMNMTYSTPMVVMSVLAAAGISIVGLRLTFGSREIVRAWSGKKILSALIMGAAIPTMHYIGMAAARWGNGPGRFSPEDLKYAISINVLNKERIIFVSLFILLMAVVSASIDRHVSGFKSALNGSSRSYAELQQHVNLLHGAFRAGGFGLWECDPATGLYYVDASLRDLFGVPDDGLPIAREVWKTKVHLDDVASVDKRWLDALATKDKYENEYRIIPSDSELRIVHSVASFVRAEDGSLARVLGMTWDVTADRQREEETRDQATRFRLTLEAIGDAVIATSDDSHIVFINPAACKLTGWDVDSATGRILGDVVVTRDEVTDAPRRDPVQRCIEHGGSFLAEDGILLSRNGSRYNIRKRVALMGECRAAVITFQDITDARRLERELLYAATHDTLTGLLNRAAFEKQLDNLWEGNRFGGRTHSLCILDIDRFKMVNDSSGHMAGDELLKDIANILRTELRPTDIVARMGGDEFMLLLTDVKTGAAELALKRVLTKIADHRFPWHGKIYQQTASVGMVAFDCFSPEPNILLSQADAAAFAAKRNGSNQVSIYSEEGTAGSRYQEMQVASDLRRCIDANLFELHAQPIVPAHAPDDARYFEVLIRMRGLDGKLVSPALFIPAAERYGMMGLIDRWVIANSLKQYRQAEVSRFGTRLAINLSGDSLSDPSLWDFVSEQLLIHDVDPRAITFEVTETALIHHLEAARGFMANFRNLGGRIALDDFGTGLSSLGYLKEFPLDIIKIDGAFIRTLRTNILDQSIVRSVADIAGSIGAQTVAECVEDMESMDLLKKLNVDWIQGWATGRPIPLQAALATVIPQNTPVPICDKSQRPFLVVASVA